MPVMNPESFIDRLSRQELLSEQETRQLCDKAVEIINQEANVLQLVTPISVCGDVHGQLPDLLELFQVAGKCPWHVYLFLGDYVDRGYNSIETYLILLCLKILYPSRIYLLRGNHESEEITQVYGFYDECLQKYGTITVWKHCLNTFNVLPLAALIDNKVFCVHGGLSPDLKKIDELTPLERKMEVPHSGVICDLLWSDPEEGLGWNLSPRGAGFLFGADVVDSFRHDNKVEFVCRAHQLVLEGYKWHFKNTCLTVWSAPNYCYRCGNVASVLELSEGRSSSFIIFDAAPKMFRGTIPKRPQPEYFL